MLPALPWKVPSPDVFHTLRQGHVHVWQVRLNHYSEQVDSFKAFLTPEELARGDRFKVPDPQIQFIITRSCLRLLLSQYLSTPPLDIHLTTASSGKPYIQSPQALPLQFNVSHTKGLALLAFSWDCSVGIDTERMDRTIEDGDIATRYFSKREAAHLSTLSPTERKVEFFKYWTCKEAFLKMLGTGLTEHLSDCEITLQPPTAAARVTSIPGAKRDLSYSLFWLDLGESYMGAMSVEDTPNHIRYLSWEHPISTGLVDTIQKSEWRK